MVAKSDPYTSARVQSPDGGIDLVIASGGSLVLETGAKLFSDGVDVTETGNLTALPLASETLTTTDATSNQVIATYTPPINTMIAVEVNFLARKVGGGDALHKRSTAAFLVDGDGGVTAVGSTLTGSSHVTAGATTWAVAVDTDATVIRAKVTGQAATSINWVAEMEQSGLVGVV